MTTINSTESNASILTDDRTMTDNNFVAAEIEEGVVADPAEATSPTQTRPYSRLSWVSRQYDIDGDGILDPTELASRLYLSSVVSLHHS